MLLLTKQWEGDSGRKGEGERVEETRAAFVMLGFGKGTRDVMTSETAIQRGRDPYPGQRWEAKQSGKEDEGKSEPTDIKSLLHPSPCGSVLLIHAFLVFTMAI